MLISVNNLITCWFNINLWMIVSSSSIHKHKYLQSQKLLYVNYNVYIFKKNYLIIVTCVI